MLHTSLHFKKVFYLAGVPASLIRIITFQTKQNKTALQTGSRLILATHPGSSV